jgi:hypothetical protein
MCLLAILYRVVDGCPVLVAANREESYDRQGTPPQLWSGTPSILAGKDTRAGGTWLGANEHGVLVAITNRPKPTPDPVRSRGLLCRDLLSCASVDSACQQALRELTDHPYAGCNVLTLDAAHAYVIHSGEKLEARSLEPGIHALSHSDADEPSDRRVAYALDWINQHANPNGKDKSRVNSMTGKPLSDWITVLGDLCKDHGDERHPAICLHKNDRGTVSSSIIALGHLSGGWSWLHAQGPPCRNEYVDYSNLLTDLFRIRRPSDPTDKSEAHSPLKS